MPDASLLDAANLSAEVAILQGRVPRKLPDDKPPKGDAETFEEWRTNFMKEQTDEGRKDECGNIRPSPEIGRT